MKDLKRIYKETNYLNELKQILAKPFVFDKRQVAQTS
jgi:hypothetical protein